MDWTSFVFGLVSGMLAVCLVSLLIAWRWMRPYLKKAHASVSSPDSLSPGLAWPPSKKERSQ